MAVSKVNPQNPYKLLTLIKTHSVKAINYTFLGAFLLSLYCQKSSLHIPKQLAPSNQTLKHAFQTKWDSEKIFHVQLPSAALKTAKPFTIYLNRVNYRFDISGFENFENYKEELKQRKDKKASLILYSGQDPIINLSDAFIDKVEDICLTLVRGWRDSKRCEKNPSYFKENPFNRKPIESVHLIECSLEESHALSFRYIKTLPLQSKEDENTFLEEAIKDLENFNIPEKKVREAESVDDLILKLLNSEQGLDEDKARTKLHSLVNKLSPENYRYLFKLPHELFVRYSELLIIKYLKD